MECLKSFSLVSSFNGTVPVGTSLDIWGVVPRYSWAYQRNSTGSTFTIQGFKNINVHKIEVVGEFFTANLNAGNSINVDDWILYVQVYGQNPLIGGIVTASPNDLGMSYPASNPVFSLSKYATSINFADPILSVRNIGLLDVRASGLSAQTAASINLGWYMNLFVYYTFEGEE